MAAVSARRLRGIVLLPLLLAPAAPIGAGRPSSGALAGGSSLAAAATPSPSPALPRFTFASGPGGSILVHGTYPKVSSPCVNPVRPLLHARFPGTIEVGKDEEGRLFIIGVLSPEDYVKGIAEMPRLWPMQALKAQAVAARSYAFAHMAYPDPTGAALGYQLCATDACQVYLGQGIADGPYGDRWRRAVDKTRGQVLLYRGRPADALYFSTSNGRTLGNDQVFGTDPLPYLRPVTERDDGASPLSRWQARVALPDVARFLRRAGDWGSGPVTALSGGESGVTVKGGGVSKTLTAATFRGDVNAWAHCLLPSKYPPVNQDNGTDLPQTVPSIWFSASTSGGSAVLSGRGWGHGVGMVQWGAEGKAERGLSYREILAAYYGGLQPVAFQEPAQIRIGIATGLKMVRLSGVGAVSLVGNATPGPWKVTGGALLRVRPADPPPSYIDAGTLDAPARTAIGRTISATVRVPQLSVVHLELSSGDTAVPFTDPTTYEAGTATIKGTIPSVTTGDYTIQAVVTDGTDIVRTPARSIHIKGLPPTPSPSPISSPSSPSALPTNEGGGSSWALPAGGLAAAVAAGGGAVVWLRRRRRASRARSPSASP